MKKFIVVHTGARDKYKVAESLVERNCLKYLVTNSYESSWLVRVANFFSPKTRGGRKSTIIPNNKVISIPYFELIRNVVQNDKAKIFLAKLEEKVLGYVAAKLAVSSDVYGIISYNYCGYDAFRCLTNSNVKKILFQCHPHPLYCKKVFEDEIKKNPECIKSLLQEKEMSWGDSYLEKLVSEIRSADHIIVPSSFCKETLIENNVTCNDITVVNYGVDFNDSAFMDNRDGVFRILFVGQMGQRKGIKYLIEACESIDMSDKELCLCGRGFDLDNYVYKLNYQWLKIYRNISSEQLASLYTSSQMFILPSVAEGFGHVILEAMSYGLPVVVSNATAAYDVVEDGCDGRIIDVGDVKGISDAIDFFYINNDERNNYARRSFSKYSHYGWEEFKKGVYLLSQSV